MQVAQRAYAPMIFRYAHARSRPGDPMVHLDVAIPTKLDDEQTALLKQLADLRSEDVVRVVDDGAVAGGGLFTRLKDAFSPR